MNPITITLKSPFVSTSFMLAKLQAMWISFFKDILVWYRKSILGLVFFLFLFFLFCFWVLEKAFRVLGGWSEGGTRRKGWWVCGQGVKQTNKQTKDYLQRGRILLPSRYWYLHFMFFSCLIAIAKNSSSILSKGKDMLCCSWIDNKQFQFVCI